VSRYAQKENDNLDALLSGKSPTLPAQYKHYKTSLVVYRMRGGESAQKWFAKNQKHALQKQFIPLPEVLTETMTPDEWKPTHSNPQFQQLSLRPIKWYSEKMKQRFESSPIGPIEFQYFKNKPAISVHSNSEAIHSDTDEASNQSEAPGLHVPEISGVQDFQQFTGVRYIFHKLKNSGRKRCMNISF